MESSTIEYLRNASRILKKINPLKFGNIISQLRQKYVVIAAEAPNNNERILSSEICKCCGNPWFEGFYSLCLLSHKPQIRKHLNKIEKKSASKRLYMSYYEKMKDNVMVKKCLICKSTTKCPMNKPPLKIEAENLSICSTSDYVENCKPVQKKRKRKGIKQRFSGLSPAAVLQTRTSFSQMEMEDRNENTSNDTNRHKKSESNSSVINLNANNVSLFSKTGKSENFLTVPTCSEIDSSESHKSKLSTGSCKSKLKKKGEIIVLKKKHMQKKPQLKKTKKSFVSEFLSLL